MLKKWERRAVWKEQDLSKEMEIDKEMGGSKRAARHGLRRGERECEKGGQRAGLYILEVKFGD
jgi:hypothetical protein